MRHRAVAEARRGDPRRASATRWWRIWAAVIAVGALVCGVAAFALLSPVDSDASTFAANTSTRSTTPADAVISSPERPVSSTSDSPAAADPGAESDAKDSAGTDTSKGSSATETSPALVEFNSLAGVPASIRLSDSATPIPVVPIGVSADGVLEPPDDISTAGWWVAGPRLGTAGRAIITGHIDSRAGLGAFAALDNLQPGDRIEVTGADSQLLHYVVTQRDEIAKTQLDPAVLSGSDASDLLLVTCIGKFDRTKGSYESNLLITAVQTPN